MYRILLDSDLPALIFMITFFFTTNLAKSQNWLQNDFVNDSLKQAIAKQMVQIQGGDVHLGDPALPNYRQNQKSVEAFDLSCFEVSNQLFKQFVDSEFKAGTPACGFWKSYFGNSLLHHPVRCVTFNEAQQFVKWLSKVTGEPYRLPTEAEWEFTAKCGHDYRYGTLNGKIDNTCANFSSQTFATVPIESFSPNSWGINNLSGNVWEWVDGSIDVKFSNSSTSEKLFLLKGGSCVNQVEDCTSFSRHHLPPDVRAFSCGFRLAKSK
jgi:formylglycine-generating enzyme required for sulfatase activity